MLTKDRQVNILFISVGSLAIYYTVPIVEKFVERAKAIREWSASQRQGTDLIVQPKPVCRAPKMGGHVQGLRPRKENFAPPACRILNKLPFCQNFRNQLTINCVSEAK